MRFVISFRYILQILNLILFLARYFSLQGINTFKMLKNWASEESADRNSWLKLIKEKKRVNQDARSRGEPIEEKIFDNLEDINSFFLYGDNPTYRNSIVNKVIQQNASIRASSCRALYDAILANPCLRRFHQLDITFRLAYLDCWSDDVLNSIGDLQSNRNDFPDTMLALYAADGDTILTDDKRLRKAFRYCDPDENVRLSSWKDLVK